MKITHRGAADAEISHRVQNDNSVGQKKAADPRAPKSGESAKVNISQEARELQRIAELARTSDEMRADKVRAIKEQVAAGEYQVDAKDVASSILRSEVTRLLKE
jgi:negative regulator of flagellin synthesis FlgM